ncbi:hypothetical protein M0805_004961 [Coniferiporia weirii]|nr:hypothetical protein M0805_004961 [Coniferiporia weirii]
MLPAPVSSRRRQYRKPSSSGITSTYDWSYRIHLLFLRSRVTNLAVLLLVASLVLSLLVNIRHWVERGQPSNELYDYYGKSSYLAYGRGRTGTPKSIEDTIGRSVGLQKLEHLIVVPGHGVWLGSDVRETLDEYSWAMQNYHNGGGGGAQTRIEAFVGHIRKGVELADADPKSLLVFSGGATQASTPRTESTSYLSLALALSLLGPSFPTRFSSGSYMNTYGRTATEEYALDSFQNLLFSIARFRTVTGRYPARVTVVGYAMKESRFDELHRAALRWPTQQWEYVGIDMEHEQQREVAIKGELENGYMPYMRDLYGCHGSLLEKRRARNVHYRAHPYHISAPEIASLLEWCPGDDTEGGKFTRVFDGPLPWDNL